ncbi:MAG: hypothetical protein IBJ11_11300 [Phycisphaerales bacterium]|nr:hypothetical protein [Phycisphaerales bacterium]
MRVRHRGFALIVVLLAAAMVFALAVQGAVFMRASAVEARVLHERTEAERAARSAAVLVLTGLTVSENDPRVARSLAVARGAPTPDAGIAPPGKPEDDKDKLQLPPIIRELLKGQLQEEEKKDPDNAGGRAQFAAALEGGGLAASEGPSGLAVLKSLGLPGRPVDVREGGSAFRVEVSDAAGLIDVNTVPRDRLDAYLRGRGVPVADVARIVEQILYWRGDPEVPFPDARAAEAWRRAGVTPRRGRMGALEELLFLPSVTRELLDLIKPDLCLAGDGKLHAGSVSREALLSLPRVDADVVRAILELRDTGTLNDHTLDRALPLGRSDLRDLLRARPSNILRLVITITEGPGAGRRFEGLAVVDDTGLIDLGLRPLL